MGTVHLSITCGERAPPQTITATPAQAAVLLAMHDCEGLRSISLADVTNFYRRVAGTLRVSRVE